MKIIFLLTAALCFIVNTQVNAQTTEWMSDKSHSTVQFSVSHLLISESTGTFKNFEAVVETDNPDFKNALITISIDVESLDTDDQSRDKHLLSQDFFDVKTFPSMEFISMSFENIEGNRYKLRGNLTIKDVTREEEFEVIYGGTVNDPYGNIKAGFKLVGKINRFDYGLKWNTLLESGGAVVGEEVTISCNIELNKNF